MKNLWLAFIGCWLAMSLVTMVFAATTQSAKSNPEERRFIGTVVVADRTTKTLVVKAWWREVIFDVATARFAEDGSLQELKPGDRVLIRYIEDNGKKIVGSIIKADRKRKTAEKAQSGTHVTMPPQSLEN